MSAKCSQCAAPTIWDDDVGSAVCTSCGSLVDPSQSVLTSAQYQNDSVEASIYAPASTTLKSLRSGNNWDLSGQGKDARDRRNAAAIADFIKSLAASFNVSGLSPRAITLFNQARSTSKFRWGTRSRSVAAACFAITLRESNRSDSIRDIASVLDVAPNSVAREFTRITSALGLSLTLVDPSVHISTLQVHLSSVLSRLSSSLSIPLGKLNLHSTTVTATSLSYLLARLSPGHAILTLPAPATACATFMLALEAENRATLNPLGELAKSLGERFQVAKGVVMTRYKTIQDEVASWAENVPWLDKYETKGGRAKISKRLVVARGLKDVIQFQDNIWQERTKPSLLLHLVDEEQEAVPSHDQSLRTGSNSSRSLAQATRFLLDPLGTPIVPLPSTSEFSNSQLSLATYLLATPSASISGRVPSRLQLLATLRGGADEDKIADEELFAKGELEGMLRNENEVRTLRETLGWPEGDSEDVLKTKGKKRRAKVTEGGEEADDILSGSAFRGRKKTRLDMDALTQFLAEDHGGGEPYEEDSSLQLIGMEEVVDKADYLEWELGEKLDDYVEQHTHESAGTVLPMRPSDSVTLFEATAIASTSASQDGELILNEWRTPSPEIGLAFNDSRYEEERPP